MKPGIILSLPFFLLSCSGKTSEQQDRIYSRHLQKHITLSIINTPIPKNKTELNLLLVNDGQDAKKFRIKEIVDSLYKKQLIQPLLVVAICTDDRMMEYGVSGMPGLNNQGAKAAKYDQFINDELYPYIKKKSGTRRFNSVAIIGCSLGGLDAFDVAWNHADKIDKAGVFSGSFWWRDKEAADPDYSEEKNRIMLAKIKSSRKKPHLKYWFYAGAKEEESDRDKDGLSDVIDDTKDLIEIIKQKKICPPDDIVYVESSTGTHDYESWSRQLPKFLLWAFGK